MRVRKIVISRTDSIGDVALSLPLVGILKNKFPESTIIFLGRNYTKNIIQCCSLVDQIWNWDEISDKSELDQITFFKESNIDVFIHVFPRKEISKIVKKAKIPFRIGTSHRFHHIFTCNKLVNFTRKKSDLHEAQLNVKLLQPLGIEQTYSLEELNICASFTNLPAANTQHIDMLDANKKNLIFHAKSQGSALEWGVDKFLQLAKNLDPNKFKIFFTGTEKESAYFRHLLPDQNNIVDLSGKMTLDELIGFISKADLLLAASTGPLHIAGLTGIKSMGLYSPRRPVHPGRWRPLGNNISILEEKTISARDGLLDISVEDVHLAINASWINY